MTFSNVFFLTSHFRSLHQQIFVTLEKSFSLLIHLFPLVHLVISTLIFTTSFWSNVLRSKVEHIRTFFICLYRSFTRCATCHPFLSSCFSFSIAPQHFSSVSFPQCLTSLPLCWSPSTFYSLMHFMSLPGYHCNLHPPPSLYVSQEGTIRWRSGICSTGGTMWSGSWGGATSPPYGYAGTYSESHTCTQRLFLQSFTWPWFLSLTHTHHINHTHHTYTCWLDLIRHCNNGWLAPKTPICTILLFLCSHGNQGGWMTVSSSQCHLSLTYTQTNFPVSLALITLMVVIN